MAQADGGLNVSKLVLYAVLACITMYDRCSCC